MCAVPWNPPWVSGLAPVVDNFGSVASKPRAEREWTAPSPASLLKVRRSMMSPDALDGMRSGQINLDAMYAALNSGQHQILGILDSSFGCLYIVTVQPSALCAQRRG